MKAGRRFLIILLSLILPLQILATIPTIAITPTTSDIDPSSFSPGDGNGLNDICTITVTYTASQNLYVNIFNQTSSALVAEDRAMAESPSGTYVYTWNGKDDSNEYVPDGTYTVRISDNPTSNGDTIGTVDVNTTAPGSPSLSIDGGNDYATSVSVDLTISATSATKMKVSNYANFSGATWENYATTKSWQLSSGDGEKTVYINFKTSSGASASTSDTITLDTTLADPTLSINSGATSTNDRDVTLSITANGATHMKIDNDTAFSNMSSWISVASTYNFTLPTSQSNPTVYLRVKDSANNQKTTSDSIIVDTTGPTNLSISINNGASYTNSTSVDLTLSANGGPSTMYLSNNEVSWTEYSYDTSKEWTLSSGDGSKTVYFQAKDAAGNNATDAVSASITLDTTNPSSVTLSSPGIGATVTTQTPTFSWSNPNNMSETRTFYIEILQSGSVKASAYTNSSTTSYTVDTRAEGSYTWRVTVYDMANNTAITSQRSFTIDVEGLAVPTQDKPDNNNYVNSSAFTDNEIILRWNTVSGEGVEYDYRYGLAVDNQNNSASTSLAYGTIEVSYTNDQIIYWSVRARNNSGSTAYCTNRSFTIDTQEPTLNSISIDSGANNASSTSVDLTLSATGASYMMLSNYANFSGASWEDYSTLKEDWPLLSGDGLKTVYFKAKDEAVGDHEAAYPNINSSAISDQIDLDTTGPTITNGIPSSSTTSTTPQISAEFSDAYAGVDNSTLIITVDDVNQTANAIITSSVVQYTPSTALSTGSHTVNITLSDNIGNIGYYEWTFSVTSDDDGNGGNGDDTPTGGPTSAVTFSNILPTSSATITSSDSITVSVDITASVTVGRVTVNYTHSGGANDIVTMTTSDNTTYTKNIGSFAAGTLTFKIEVADTEGLTYESDSTTVTIIDTTNPTITSVSPENGSVIKDTTPLIQASYSDDSGIDTSSVKIAFNGVDVTDNATITSSKVSYEPDSELTYSTYKVTVEVADTSGNKASTDWTFTIIAETVEQTEFFEDVSAGETIEWTNDEESSVEGMTLIASDDIDKIRIDITTTGEIPEGVTQPEQSVYKFLIIETNKTTEVFSSATIDFKIEQIWFTTNKIDKNSVKLVRYSDNSWGELTTSMISEDDEYVYYQATTSGFSVFAIVGSKIAEEPTEDINWILILGGVAAVVVLIIVILFKSGIIYLEDRDKSKKPKKEEEIDKEIKKKEEI